MLVRTIEGVCFVWIICGLAKIGLYWDYLDIWIIFRGLLNHFLGGVFLNISFWKRGFYSHCFFLKGGFNPRLLVPVFFLSGVSKCQDRRQLGMLQNRRSFWG